MISEMQEAKKGAISVMPGQIPMLVANLGEIAGASDGVARLRRLILSLAIRGKLVPQHQADDNAGVLLARIQEAKNRLVAKGAIKLPKGRRSSAANGAQLPAGWQWATLSDVCVVVTDGDHLPPPKAARGVPFLVIGDVRSGHIDLSRAERFVTREYFRSLDWSRRPLIGDILYTTVGSFGIPVPVVEDGEFCFQRHIALLRPGLSSLQPYLLLALGSPEVFEQASQGATGIAQKTVSLSVLRNMRIPLPPLAEQRRIVARVEELMKSCDALKAKQRLADEQHARLTSTLFEALAASESAEALAENWQRVAEHFDLLLDRPSTVDRLEAVVLELALRGRLVPQVHGEESAERLMSRLANHDAPPAESRRTRPLAPAAPTGNVPFDLPETWAWAGFRQVAIIASNLVDPARFPEAWQVAPDCIEKGTGRLISMRTVRKAGVISANHAFRSGQILYSKIRPSLSKAVIVDFDGLCSADMYPVQSRIDTRFLHLVMLSRVFLDQVREAENRVKMPKLNQEALNSFLVPVPPLVEQHRIVARVEELRGLCAQLRERLSAAREVQSRLADALVASVA